MCGVAFITGFLPNILSSKLSSVFTPTALSVPTFAQPLIAALITRMVGLQYLPHWPVWLALVILLIAQISVRESILEDINIPLEERSQDSKQGGPKVPLQAPVLV